MLESFLILDGGALTDAEIGKLEELGDAATWIYGDLGDAVARRMGPVCVPASNAGIAGITSAFAATPQRHWALSWIHVDMPCSPLQHLRTIRYVRTADSQRYFFRFADSRSMEAMIRSIAAYRARQLFGPVCRWDYLTRAGKQASWHRPEGAPAEGGGTPRIDDKELSALLEAMWPDQLLASAIEAEPELADRGSTEARHAWIAHLCELLRRERIDRHPEQLALAIRTLGSCGAILEPEAFSEAVQSIRSSID